MKMNKLVRDKIPQSLRDRGMSVVTEEPYGEELQRYYHAKVLEELSEYFAAEDPAELTDVLEAIFALALNNHGINRTGLLTMADDKFKKHGGFLRGYVLREVTE